MSNSRLGFAGGNRIDNQRVLVNDLQDDRDLLPRGGLAKGDRPTRRLAGDHFFSGVQDVFDLVDREAVLGDVLNVAFGVIVQVPQDATDPPVRLPLV